MSRKTVEPPIVLALGGNAILQRGEQGTFEEQYRNVQKTAGKIARLVRQGLRIVITHGNGPQIGATLIRHEIAKAVVPALPLHACGAETQGFLGYMIQQSLQSELAKLGLKKTVVTIVTQVVVNREDPAFQNPTKPIGPFYNEGERDQLVEKRRDLVIREDAGRGYRRVVPSPNPISLVETEAIESLVRGGTIVVAGGGGGIPVIKSDGRLVGVDAVIDKDLAAEKLATSIRAKTLAIMTDVDGVFINYGTKSQKLLSKINPRDLAELAKGGHFASGSMAPKVEAALRFVKNGGERTVIARLDAIEEALQGTAGTQVMK